MLKKKILLFIPLTIIASLLTYSWTQLLMGNTIAVWQHYLAILLFVPLGYVFFKDFKKAVIGMALYLLAATFNIISLSPAISSTAYGTHVGSAELWTPQFQLLAFCLFLVFVILNFNALVDIWADFQEWKIKRKQ